MAKLLYINNLTADGYINDADGRFDWTEPSEEFFELHTELQRSIGTHLYGRRLYGFMSAWETLSAPPDSPGQVEFGQLWRAADKVVYSTTLAAVSTNRTRLERSFDPVAVQRMKEVPGPDIMVGGANLAGQAIAAGLVDELHLVILPHLAGGGVRALPENLTRDLTLLDQRSLANGAVYVRYGML